MSIYWRKGIAWESCSLNELLVIAPLEQPGGLFVLWSYPEGSDAIRIAEGTVNELVRIAEDRIAREEP